MIFTSRFTGLNEGVQARTVLVRTCHLTVSRRTQECECAQESVKTHPAVEG
jgi:hypothetical protein